MSRPLLEADFLWANSLLVDLKGKCLINAETFLSVPLHQALFLPSHLHDILTSTNQYDILLTDFQDIMVPKFAQPTTKHGDEHFILTRDPPVHAHCLPPDKLALAKKEFASMEAMGIIQHLSSPWATKASGGWCPYRDYRHLNDVTVPDRYPVPHIQDFSTNLAGTRIFSKIDLVRGYYQILMKVVDIPKTAINTPSWLYEFLRMPFGLKNAAQSFQHLMDTVCQDLESAFLYMDDILVASKDGQEHKDHLCQLFWCLQDHGLVINVAKCQFGSSTIDFLGHRITQHGVLPFPDKVEAITQFKQPLTVKGLQEFVDMVNFYHRFILAAAKMMSPLYSALAGKPKTPKTL